MRENLIKKTFLERMELFYRNFGSKWSVQDFSEKEKDSLIIKEYLIELEELNIIRRINDDEFEIMDLPSNVIENEL